MPKYHCYTPVGPLRVADVEADSPKAAAEAAAKHHQVDGHWTVIKGSPETFFLREMRLYVAEPHTPTDEEPF